MGEAAGCIDDAALSWLRLQKKCLSQPITTLVSVKPRAMFGKIMSISDDLMWDYYDLLSFRPLSEIADLKIYRSRSKPA